MKFAFTGVCLCLFVLFIGHSLWNLITLFQTPTCDEKDNCFASYFNAKPALELLVYITDSSKSTDGQLVFHLANFNYDEPFEENVSIAIPDSVHRNGSLYIHTAVIPRANSHAGMRLSEVLLTNEAVLLKKRLTQYATPKSFTFNLLQEETRRKATTRPIPHLKGRFAIIMCTDAMRIAQMRIPIEILRYFRVNHKREFLPIVQQDFLQTRLRDLVEIGDEMERMSFVLTYAPTSIGKLRFLIQVEATLVQFLKFGFTQKDLDEVKGVFADTNLYLLCATIVVGSIHLLLDFLSFKNDVSFWKSNKSMAGLSMRTVLWRAFSQTIIFLFLLDEGTSLLVLIPSGIATVIEFWKIKKALRVQIVWSNLMPHFQCNEQHKESVAEAKTKEYDRECMKYLSYLLYPLCIGAASYSLIYQPHKSWYSWTINSVVNAVYAFGFLFMMPQLFVNYRLKSVAALPWKAFMYRAFNTFIDDIFAFIISMPIAHRVACFRDDIVFVIYLYQRWLYPVDKSRIDESVAPDEEPATDRKKTN